MRRDAGRGGAGRGGQAPSAGRAGSCQSGDIAQPTLFWHHIALHSRSAYCDTVGFLLFRLFRAQNFL
ncbi:hypothetical protein, partial [Inquilinus sp. OTU3971]|uniref:hypothetical protein n=1 Tax=Inquilinus sp. OTU3971 TaxID=3043855 RepID=UPI00313BA572